MVASGDEVLAEAPLITQMSTGQLPNQSSCSSMFAVRRRAVEHCCAVDDQEEGGTSAAEVAQMVVIGCKWHLASGLEAANEVSGLGVQVAATFMVSRSSTWR